MIYTFQMIALVLVSLFSAGTTQNNTEEFKLIVDIDNIKHTSGQVIRIAVSKKSDFLKDVPQYEYAVVPASTHKISQTFKLPPGDYAVSVYHDVNGNGEMDKNFFGAPNEPYAFSRNYKPVFRAPKFDEVKINLNGDRKASISLIQP